MKRIDTNEAEFSVSDRAYSALCDGIITADEFKELNELDRLLTLADYLAHIRQQKREDNQHDAQTK
jgi:hypothetical protein